VEVRCGTRPTAAKRYLFTSRGRSQLTLAIDSGVSQRHLTSLAHLRENLAAASLNLPKGLLSELENID
jgi:hypothetical protein